MVPKRISSIPGLQWYRFIRYSFLLLTAIILAQWGVPAADIGGYELMFHLLYVLTFFWVNGVFQSVLIRTRRLSDLDRKEFLGRIWFLILLLTVSFTLLLWLLGADGGWLLFGLSDFRYWQLYVLLFGLSVPPLVYEYFLLARNQIRELLVWGGVSYTLHIIVTLAPFLLGYGLREMLWAHIGLSLLRFLYVGWDLGMPRFRLPDASWWASSGHLTLYSVLGGVPIAFDTWLVGFMSQAESEIAIFRYGARELPLFMILLGSVHLIILSDTDRLEDALHRIRKQIQRHLPLLAGLSGLLCLLSPLLFPILFTETFSESAVIFNVYLLLLLSRMNLSHTVMMRMESYRLMNLVAFAEVLLNVILSVWWVQYWGWMGIALATVVAYLFEKVAFSLWLYFKKDISLDLYLPVRSYIGYSSLVVICFILGSFILYE